MAHSRKPDMKYNESGCIDKTAYATINRIRKDERKKIIYEMKELAQKHGYKIISIIRLREIEGEKFD